MDDATLTALADTIERSVYSHVDAIDGLDGMYVARDVARFFAEAMPAEPRAASFSPPRSA